MEGLYTTGSENFIKNFDLVAELHSDITETSWEFCYICECNFKISSDSGILIRLQSFNDCLKNQRVFIVIEKINDLVFSFKVYRAAHQN